MHASICERHSFATVPMSQCLGLSSGQIILPASVFMHGTFNRVLRALQHLYRNSMEYVKGEEVQLHLRAQLFIAASEASRIPDVRSVMSAAIKKNNISAERSEAQGSERSERPSAGKAEHKTTKLAKQTKCAVEDEALRGRSLTASDDVYSISAKKRHEHSEYLSRMHLKGSSRRNCENSCNNDFVGNDSRRPTKSSLQNVS